MFMAIDIGNTHTVIGIYKADVLIIERRMASVLRRKENKTGMHVHSILSEAGIDIEKIDGIGISSVVPGLTDVYSAMTQKYFHLKPLIVNTELNLGIKIHYNNPKSLGADRLCNAVAGYAKYGGPLIIIDFGTATTYDVVGSNGDFLGGVITPGIDTSAASLHRRAAKLPKVELHLPDTIIGIDTVSSMQTGILWGALDAMTGMVKRIQKELQLREQKKAVVLATGGFSKFIAAHSNLIQHIEPSLVLEGIHIIYKRVTRKKK